MRKTAIILLVLVTVLIFNFHQDCSAQELSFGLKCGVNVSNLSQDYTDYASDTDVKTGLVTGIYADISILSSLEVQPEILFSQKGWVESGNDFKCNYRINYLELPLLVKISFGDIVRPYLVVGPYFSYRLGTSYYKEIVNNLPISGDLDDVIKKTDVGLSFGIGAQTPAKFTIEGRYSLSLNSISNDTDIEIKNTNVSILIGFKLF